LLEYLFCTFKFGLNLCRSHVLLSARDISNAFVGQVYGFTKHTANDILFKEK
jgi:hypothetical protein